MTTFSTLSALIAAESDTDDKSTRRSAPAPKVEQPAPQVWPIRPKVKAIIQCAMELESAPVLEVLEYETRSRPLVMGAPGAHQQSFTMGIIDGHHVLVVTSGIGLANAASAIARALTMVEPEIVIAAGTVGGLGVDVQVGDIAASFSATYHSADATAFGYERGQIPQMPQTYQVSDRARTAALQLAGEIDHRLVGGQVVSGDSFITAELVAPIREAFPEAVATDMETTAIAQVCWSSGVEWISLCAVSDLCGPVAGQDFHMDSSDAAKNSAEAVQAFLGLY